MKTWSLFTLAAVVILAGCGPGQADFLSGCTAQVPGYQGTWTDVVRGEQDVRYRAPDRLAIRDLSSGQVHVVDGSTVWDYDPETRQADITYNAPEPFGPPGAQVLVPGRTQLQRFIDANQQRYRIIIEDIGPVAGRETFRLRLSPRPEEPLSGERLLWIDRQTCLALQDQRDPPEGPVSGFATVRYEPPEAMAEPSFPPGTMVTTHSYGTVADLSARAGLHVTEPTPLPAGWRFDHAYLTIYPDRGQGQMKALSWYYTGAAETALAVTAWSPPRLPPGTTESVPLAPGVTGQLFRTEIPDWPAIAWVNGDLSYNLSGPTLSREQLVALARSMITP